MMKGCGCKGKELTWTDLMNARGEDLWEYRRQALSSVVFLDIYNNKSQVCVYSDPNLFRIEEQNGMEKESSNSKALTNLTGQEWECERDVFVNTISDIKERSLEAASRVVFDPKLKAMDLKGTVQTAALRWMIYLFRGQDDEELTQAFFEFWQEIRKSRKNQTVIKNLRETFEGTLSWDGGLLEQLRQSKLTSDVDNAVNAMTAAFETTSSIIFWGIWNLSRTKTFDRCRNMDAQREGDLEKLAILKKRSTEGQPVSYDGLSYLGRVIAETVRVYPPVWTLPRVGNLPSKFDVVSANEALSRDWNPESTKEVHIQSFGVGRRTCPAGTAALFAAHTIITTFVDAYDSIEECRPNRALRSTYLGPTLCVEGLQNFKVKRGSKR